MALWVPHYTMANARTLSAFMRDRTLLRIVVGPIGSGKSTACCLMGYMHACEQEVSPTDDYRRFKLSVIRNTMPELRKTTLSTWRSVFDERYCGPVHDTTPVQHLIRLEPQTRGAHRTPGLLFMSEFFSLDRPQDIRALLSYEPTALWFNEIREAPEDLVHAAIDRCGRYPSMAQGGVPATWQGVFGDTNAPDEDHWIADMDRDRPPNVRIFHQPPGVLEMEPSDQPGRFVSKAGRVLTVPASRVASSADKFWAVNPDAENLVNLPVVKQIDPAGDPRGLGSYYLRSIGSKSANWIRSYYQGKYAFVADGKPVIEEFNADVHVVDNIQPLANVPITGGLDVGGGTLAPAAIFGQRHPRGIYLVLAEVSLYSAGLKRFSEELLRVLAQPRFTSCTLGTLKGDPAGAKRDEIFEDVVFHYLQGRGIPVVAARTNDIQTRIEAIRAPFTRMVDGKPGILIDRSCKRLIKGLSGAWKYRKVAVPGQVRYVDKPDKGPYSHVCDSLGYWVLEEGEYQTLVHAGPQGYDPDQDHSEYNYFGD